MQAEGLSRVAATALGLAAFAIAIVAGLHAGNPSSTVLMNAILCMVACQFVGLFIGSIGDRVVREHVASIGAEPVPGAGVRVGGAKASESGG